MKKGQSFIIVENKASNVMLRVIEIVDLSTKELRVDSNFALCFSHVKTDTHTMSRNNIWQQYCGSLEVNWHSSITEAQDYYRIMNNDQVGNIP